MIRMFKLRYCKVGHHYTLKEFCHGERTVNPHPPRFNPNDPYGKYRRMMLHENYIERDKEKKDE